MNTGLRSLRSTCLTDSELLQQSYKKARSFLRARLLTKSHMQKTLTHQGLQNYSDLPKKALQDIL